MNGLELSRRYYEDCGLPMLREFPEISPLLCVALVGAGSECFGFDDEISRDHDFEPGFCLFYPEDLIDRKTVFALERAYARLPKEFLGFRRQTISPVGGNRHGVKSIEEFFLAGTGSPDGPHTAEDWFRIPDFTLAELTNGEIFYDGMGRFSEIRQRLSHQPEDVRLKKLAGHLLLAAQTGQYNLSRSLRRKEYGAAMLCASLFVQHIISSLFLLEDVYEPYYKWTFRALREFSPLADALESMLLPGSPEELPDKAEQISASVIRKIVSMNLSAPGGNYLEEYAYAVNNKIKNHEIRTENILFAVR